MTNILKRIPVTVDCGKSKIIVAYDVNGDKVEYQVVARPSATGPPREPAGGPTGVAGVKTSGGIRQVKPGGGTAASIVVMADDSTEKSLGGEALADVDILFQARLLPDIATGVRKRAVIFGAAGVRSGHGSQVSVDLPIDIDTTNASDLTFLIIDRS